MKPITSADQITPDWLTQVLRRNGYLDQGHVISVATAVGPSNSVEGPGFHSRNRLEIHYSTETPPSVPTRLYLKVQAGALHKGAGAREVAFYRSVATQMPAPPVPTCFDAVYDQESGAYHLLLEDISKTHRTVHPEEPATRKALETMLDALAQLHAYWWGHEQLGQNVGVILTADALRAAFVQLEVAFPKYVDYLGDRLSLDRRRIYEKVLERYPDVLVRRFTQREQLTVVHDDAHAGNFLLPRRADEPRSYLIDWQQWGLDSGLHDVAYLVALFWYPERRARMEEWAVREYHGRLCRYGVVGFDWQACWTDYRVQAIRNLLVPFWAWVYQGEHWGFHRWHQLEKSMLAFQDLNCEEFLK